MKKFLLLFSVVAALLSLAVFNGMIDLEQAGYIMAGTQFMPFPSTVINNSIIRQIRTHGGTNSASQAPSVQNGNILQLGSEMPLNNTAEILSANVENYPDSLNVTVTSNPGVGAGKTTVNVGNNLLFGVDDDNGSGPASITYSWDDNNAGATANANLISARAGKGAILYGGSVQSFVDAGAGPVAYPAGVSMMKASANWQNWRSDRAPIIVINTNTDNTKGTFAQNISTFKCVANWNNYFQFTFAINGDNLGNTYSLDICFYFYQNFPTS